MRKIIGANVYQDSIESNNLEFLQREEKRLYPRKKTKILPTKYGYKIWVYVGPAKGAKDPDELMLEELKEKLPDFRIAARDFTEGLPTAMRAAYKPSAKIYAVQLLDELGPVARVKRAWRKLFSGKIQVAFVGGTTGGTVGIAYTGKLIKADKYLIEEWAS